MNGDVTMVNSLEELVQNRKELIEAHRKNDFTDGIHALLTDLYPDTAHFIYELLQNAEDMNATTVRFILSEDGIDFEHNGTKRNFNLADIDAITNIGHNRQKKDDPTSIGKFGVGFKAVFAYTATPEIHSGDYHFRIKDYFVPEFENINHLRTKDNYGKPWTKFFFPFNNPKKPKQIAFKETLNGLDSLDGSSILFLQNINRIEYLLPNGEIGYLERSETKPHFITIKFKKHDSNKEALSNWLRFIRPIEITDDQGNLKKLTVSIAYALEKDSKTQKTKIIPVKGGGKTFIYFPAEKEYSGLRFHINAPFASTVARDSVRNCEDNNKLIKQVANLTAESINTIKNLNLLNLSLFEVLPNDSDSLSFFYQTIFDYIYAAFHKNDYLPTKDNNFVSTNSAVMGPATIANLFKDEGLKVLTGINKKWIKNAPQQNSNTDKFLKSLDIENFTFEDLSTIFDSDTISNTEKYLTQMPAQWLKQFYLLCANVCGNSNYFTQQSFKNGLKSFRSVLGTDNKMYTPSEIYILPKNTSRISASIPVVNQSLVIPSSEKDTSCNKIKSFFEDYLEIQEYGQKVEILRLLEKYDKGFSADDESYYKNLIAFAKYNSENNDIDFSSHELFLYYDDKDNELYIVKASDLVLGEEYENDCGKILAEVYDKHLLWNGYIDHYTAEELKIFIDFICTCNAVKELYITQENVEYHQNFRLKLNSYGKHTYNGTNFDCTIPNLYELLKHKNIQVSNLIWECLEKVGKTRMIESKYYRSYHRFEPEIKRFSRSNCPLSIARYSPNGSTKTKTYDSTLICYLKAYAWVPDKNGVLHRPCDISIDEIHENFIYDSTNELLRALDFNSSSIEAEKQNSELERMAKEQGKHVISDEEYELLERAKAAEAASTNADPASISELLGKQTKSKTTNAGSDSIPSNRETRKNAKNEAEIEKTFINSKKMSRASKELFGKITALTKEERRCLFTWYHGKCQMCNTVIFRYDHKPHFLAINVINTQHLTDSVKQTMKLAWNSLSLCPNCAAKYRYCSKDVSGLYEQIMQKEISDESPEHIVLTIELDEKMQEIHYTPEHFLALKKAIQLIDSEIQ